MVDVDIMILHTRFSCMRTQIIGRFSIILTKRRRAKATGRFLQYVQWFVTKYDRHICQFFYKLYHKQSSSCCLGISNYVDQLKRYFQENKAKSLESYGTFLRVTLAKT